MQQRLQSHLEEASTHEVVVDGAGQQPVSRVVGRHGGRGAGAWEHADGVRVLAPSGQDLAVEMNRVHVHLVGWLALLGHVWHGKENVGRVTVTSQSNENSASPRCPWQTNASEPGFLGTR